MEASASFLIQLKGFLLRRKGELVEGELEKGVYFYDLREGVQRGIHIGCKGSGLRVVLDHYFVQVYLGKVKASRGRRLVSAEVCTLVFPCVCHLGLFNFFVMTRGFIPSTQMGGNMS